MSHSKRVPMASHMALSAFRYALGRMSYYPSTVREELRWIWSGLAGETRDCILRDLDEEIARDDRSRETDANYHPLGTDYDRAGWVAFREWATSETGGKE